MIAFGVDEHLRLVLETPEGLGVEDPVAVSLEGGSQVVGRLGARSSAGAGGPERGRGEPIELLGLAGLSGAQDEGLRAQVRVSTGVRRV